MAFLTRFFGDIMEQAGVHKCIESGFVSDVMVKERIDTDKERQYLFFLNFSKEERQIAGRRLQGYEVCIEEKRITDLK